MKKNLNSLSSYFGYKSQANFNNQVMKYENNINGSYEGNPGRQYPVGGSMPTNSMHYSQAGYDPNSYDMTLNKKMRSVAIASIICSILPITMFFWLVYSIIGLVRANALIAKGRDDFGIVKVLYIVGIFILIFSFIAGIVALTKL